MILGWINTNLTRPSTKRSLTFYVFSFMENIMWWTLEARGPSRRDGGIWDDSVACYVVTRSSTSLPPPVCLESLQHPALLLNVATRPSCDLSEEFPYSVRAESTDKRPKELRISCNTASPFVSLFSGFWSSNSCCQTISLQIRWRPLFLREVMWKCSCCVTDHEEKKKKLFTDWDCLCLRNIKYWINLHAVF